MRSAETTTAVRTLPPAMRAAGDHHPRGAVSALRVLLFLLVAPPLLNGARPAAALDGFLPKPGEGTAAVSVTAESYERFWAGSETVTEPALGTVATRTLSVWLRYGVSDRIALVADVPFVERRAEAEPAMRQRSLQDARLLAKVRLLERGRKRLRHRFLVAGGVSAPAASYDPDLPVAVGDGTTDVLLRLVYQLELPRGYLLQTGGVDVRSGGAPDGLVLRTEAGWKAGPTTLSLFHELYAARSGSDIGDPGATFPTNREELQRAGLRLLAPLGQPSWALSAAAFTTLDGRNTGDAAGLSLGIVGGF